MPFLDSVTFSHGSGLLDRAAHLRDVAQDLLGHRRAALLPVWNGKILVDLESGKPKIGWVPPSADYLAEAAERPVFLGLSGETPCFAADYSHLDKESVEERFCDGAKFVDLRSVAGELPPASANIAAAAKGVIGWHASHPYCARCGAGSEPENGGWRRRCSSCGAHHFPRTDPVVIMLVLRDDHVLLGRQASWPEGLYSLLAGYMEPGETIEDAVRRETKEESGIQIGWVRYLACQPWPFPSSLMLGCAAEALTSEITIDEEEIEDALWVSRAKMEVVLQGKHPRMAPPRVDAIARAILSAWVAGEIEGV